MTKITFTLIFGLFLSAMSYGQVFLEDFDSVQETQIFIADGYSGIIADGEWTITGDGTSGAFSPYTYKPVDSDGNLTSVDVTGNNKIFVRAKASSNGTELRMDIKDQAGIVTSVSAISKFLVSSYTVYEFDFTGKYQDGGFGGSDCEMANAPCDVDGSQIVEFIFFINPSSGGFAGSVVMDFISVGTEPQVGPMSEVFQDHFDDTTSLRFIGKSPIGFTNSIEDSQWKIKGDGTNGMWDPVSMLTFNPATLDTVDISVKNGDDKVYIRMRATVPGTSIRLDLQDINNFATTAGSITKIISEEFVTYEFNFAGSYQDLAFGGTGCEVGPCDVDSDRIANMIIFINPGVEAYAGEVDIEYISVGTPLEFVENDEVLVYGDHFIDGDTYVSTSAGYVLGVNDSEFTITGDGNDAPFSAVAYNIHDMELGGNSFTDATGNNKIFIKAKSSGSNTLMRVDLVDTAGFVTTFPSFTRQLNEEYQVIEINYVSSYIDAGYGGTACEAGGPQCVVDGSAISTVLLYPDPADGGFDGTITIDYLSFGAPLGDVVSETFKYADQFDDDDRSKFGDAPGFTVEETGGELTITGDGTSGAYTAFAYIPHNQETDEDYILDVTENNKVYVKIKSTIADIPLRIDLVDTSGYATTEPATVRTVGEEYTVLEFDFTGTYNDAAYGGTGCEIGPCTVDGTQISSFLFYIDPDNGGYAGTMTIDWISTIDPLETIVAADAQDLPLDFESENVTYDLRSFGAADFGPIPVMRTDNPDASGDNTSIKVMSIEKTEGAQTWAGVAMPLASIIDFSEDNLLYVQVWSPNENTPFQLKIEDTTSPSNADGNPTVFAEVLVTATTSNAWETLVFDMAAFADFSPDSFYNQAVLFPNFGNLGAGSTYYVDNIDTDSVEVAVEITQDLPLTYETEGIEYDLRSFGAADFGPIPVEVINNPDATGINTSEKVVSVVKTAGAQVWAGVAMPLASVIDFSSSNLLYMQVWSPKANTAFNLKIEDLSSTPNGDGNPSIFAEVVATTTTTSAWEILVFDMSEFAAFDANNTYNQVVVFPDFGNAGADETFYFDNIGYEGSSSTVDLVNAKDFKIAPNPFSNEAIVSWENQDNSNYQVSILNVTGQVVRTYKNVSGESLTIRKNSMISGLYFLNFRDDKGNTGTLKMMID